MSRGKYGTFSDLGHRTALEELEVLLPEHRKKVIPLSSLGQPGALEHAENSVELLSLDAREKGDVTDAILVEQKREGIRAGRVLVDFLPDQQNSVLLNRQIEALHFLPKLLKGLSQAGDEALPNRVVMVVELKSPEGLGEHNEKPSNLHDGEVVALRPVFGRVRGRFGDFQGVVGQWSLALSRMHKYLGVCTTT